MAFPLSLTVKRSERKPYKYELDRLLTNIKKKFIIFIGVSL